MAELPELEVLKRDLEKEVVSRRIKDATVRPGSNSMKVLPRHSKRKDVQELLEGAKFEGVRRAGKFLVLDLDTGKSLVVRPGPTGRLLKSASSDELAPHTHVVLGFTIGGQLRYIDPTRQGELFVAPTEEIAGLPELCEHVIDPLEQQVAWQTLAGMLAEKNAPMKQVMRDDTFLCGLGDIYADEVLWGGGVHPERSSGRLGSQDVRRLYRALIEVLQEAVKLRGTTIGDDGFRDLAGQPGGFGSELKVYGQDGSACRRCRNIVIKEEVAGYFTFFCPQCQS